MNNLLLFPQPDREHEALRPARTALADAEDRSLALDTTASWIVEAPAGSGKTGLLMQRYLKLLASNDVAHPDEVLAITFTRKAAAELRSRVLAQLEQSAMDVELAEDVSDFDRATRQLADQVIVRDTQLGWELLANPSQLRIRTIDAVCAEIARALPLLSGSGGAGAPVEDASPLYSLAARRTMMALGGSDPVLHEALETILLHRDADLGNCESLLASMLAQREQWAELVPLDRDSLSDDVLDSVVRPRLEKVLQSIICAGLTSALSAVPRNHLEALASLAHSMANDPDHPTDSAIAVCAARSLPPGVDHGHLEHWIALAHLLLTATGTPRKTFASNHLTFSVPKPAQTMIKAIALTLDSSEGMEALHALRALPPAHYPEDQWIVAKALFRLLLRSLAELKVLFAERGECDFTEFSLAAREALGSDSGVQDLMNSSGQTLRHLLVDEMQDTSSAQYNLLEQLTQSWDGRSQTVFLVGDPKQSIYIFRQARVERFLRTMREERLGDLPVRALRLTTNFRSQAGLVAAFNYDFDLLFPKPDAIDPKSEAGDVPFVEATAVRQNANAASTVWHTAVLGDAPSASRHTPRQEHALQEALAIRRLIEEWQQRPLPAGRVMPWRIAVLARARHHLAPIIAEFQNEANGQLISFRAVDVEQLGERQEVLDVLALTRALLHPADRAAWFAVLRAPWCGLTAADLLAINGDGASISSAGALKSSILLQAHERSRHVSMEGQLHLQRALPVLDAALRRAGRMDLAELVERTWLTLGGDAVLSNEQRANVQRYIQLLRKTVELGGRLNLGALNEGLKGLYAAPSTAPNVVEMMTIHKAKGLEWDFVVLPALERRGQASHYELLNWLELDAAEAHASVLLAPIHEAGDKPGKLSTWIHKTKGSREEAERKRLLYVACTRAREELHLFGACDRKQNGDLTCASGTLLKSFWPAAQPHFAALAAPAVLTNSGAQQNINDDEEVFAIAAAAETSVAPQRGIPIIHRIPLGFDPAQRFRHAEAQRLPYASAAAVPESSALERPEGSLSVRAFGNTVHRFLELIAVNMDAGKSADALIADLPSWQSRLQASLRSEGLSPAACAIEASRALGMLNRTLGDEIGRWILSPQTCSESEATLTLDKEGGADTMRVDRMFTGGDHPLAAGVDVLWVVDFKTTEQGSRTTAKFEEEERAKYGPQLARYAEALRVAHGATQRIILGLYFPAVPRFVYWPA